MENKPRIPSHITKGFIHDKWYPNCPEATLRADIQEIQSKRGISTRKKTLKKIEIQELFVYYGYGKPPMYEQQDYENYIKDYHLNK